MTMRQARPRQHIKPHSKVVGLDTALGQQLLDIAVGEAVPQVPADRDRDHFRREPEPSEADRSTSRLAHRRRRIYPDCLSKCPRPPEHTERDSTVRPAPLIRGRSTPEGEELLLDRLSAGDPWALLRHSWPELSGPDRERVFAAAEGNPLALTELPDRRSAAGGGQVWRLTGGRLKAFDRRHAWPRWHGAAVAGAAVRAG